MDLGLSGKRCIVTGASRGIGFAVARGLLDEGARVLCVGRGLDALRAADLDGAELLAADVIEPAGCAAIVAGAVERLGGVDVLVNNAGTMRGIPLDALDDADWELQWQLNVRAPDRLMRATAPLMAQGGWGRIVNVTSSSGKRPSIRNAAYSVTKTAQLALSRAYADAWAGRGVLVNAVAPGPTGTELWLGPDGIAGRAAASGSTTFEGAIAATTARLPSGRLAEPREIADAVLFLCSERASNVMGAAWSVDGGAVQTFL